MNKHNKPIRSGMGRSTPDRIFVQGRDLVKDVIGTLNLGDMAYLEMTGRLPDAHQSRVFNAILVTLVEHGMTPMAIATRLVYLGAPESLQAAVAAGLCGMGTTFAGTAEGAARMLHEAWEQHNGADADSLARDIVADFRAKGRSIPGVGHNLHKPQDPRTARLFEVAAQEGHAGRYVELMQAIGRHAQAAYDKPLPVNATGAIGALCCELGISWKAARGIAVIGRAVGLVGHLVEEQGNPIAREIWLRTEEEASRQDQTPADAGR
ncbi:citryl-CoA lyase [Bordetella genomosp. 9]|uniref:citrate synthase (unknown stereospecificity) n=1 Tax=Bordetella genomosp. 9 TaxID=1416803 RepID=A0A261R7X8_9BORD|nr:citryl-CoA lyase [Bordetella genomosp. 9]OZI20483.1 citryl-CoA lyase [Bordetella genomosp. 9]